MLSPKQLEAIKTFGAGINLMVGSVRSGKTVVQMHILMALLNLKPEDGGAEHGIDGLMTALTTEVIEANLFTPLKRLIAEEKQQDWYEFYSNPKKIIFKPKNITIWCAGASQRTDIEKIHGRTTQFWMADEVNQYPRDFTMEGLDRMSAGCRTAVWTCNPDSNSNYIYKEYVQPKGKCRYYQFKLTDNPFLDQSYIEDLKTRHTGVYYLRRIEGEWGGEEGNVVLPEFQDNKDKIVRTMSFEGDPVMAMDIGFRDYTFMVFGFFDKENEKLYIKGERVNKKGATTTDIANMIIESEVKFFGKPCRDRWTDIDLRLVADLKQLHGINMIPIKRELKVVGVNALRVALGMGKIIIDPSCTELISHMEGAVWNEKKDNFDRAEGFGHFDGVDAMIYLLRSVSRGFTWHKNESQQIVQDWRKKLIPRLESTKKVHSMVSKGRLSRGIRW